ncbi:MAG: type II toxin-antitoxin system VapB family antitoxin [Caldilineaceae bacterium]
MRTNIVIDDQLMAEAMRLSGLKTKREVVEEALRLFIRQRSQRTVLALAGKIHWEGNLDEMRSSRFLHDEQGVYRLAEEFEDQNQQNNEDTDRAADGNPS